MLTNVVGGEGVGPGPVDVERTDPPVGEIGQLGGEDAGDPERNDLVGPAGPAAIGCQILDAERVPAPRLVAAWALVEPVLPGVGLTHQVVAGGDGVEPAGPDQGEAGMVGAEFVRRGRSPRSVRQYVSRSARPRDSRRSGQTPADPALSS